MDFCSCSLVSVCADDVPGPILDALHGNVLCRLPGSDDQDLFSSKFAGVPEIVSMHDAARKRILEERKDVIEVKL